jgi:hypothetical protein
MQERNDIKRGNGKGPSRYNINHGSVLRGEFRGELDTRSSMTEDGLSNRLCSRSSSLSNLDGGYIDQHMKSQSDITKERT